MKKLLARLIRKKKNNIRKKSPRNLQIHPWSGSEIILLLNLSTKLKKF
jgi:hypothetical protein